MFGALDPFAPVCQRFKGSEVCERSRRTVVAVDKNYVTDSGILTDLYLFSCIRRRGCLGVAQDEVQSIGKHFLHNAVWRARRRSLLTRCTLPHMRRGLTLVRAAKSKASQVVSSSVQERVIASAYSAGWVVFQAKSLRDDILPEAQGRESQSYASQKQRRLSAWPWATVTRSSRISCKMTLCRRDSR